MNLRQMFPRMTLDPEDVLAMCGAAGTTVEIEAVEYKTLEARRPGDAEIAYFLTTREFKRPIKLNRNSAYAIAQVLGTEETDDWVGQLIRIQPAQISIGTNRVWVFNVDLVAPREPSGLRPKQDIAGMAADAKRADRGLGPGAGRATGFRIPATTVGSTHASAPPIGIDQAAQVWSTLHERGKTVQDLYAFLKDLGMDAVASGKELHEWPATTLAAARTFCKSLPRVNAPMTAAAIEDLKARWQPPPPPRPPAAKPAEVVDRRTGEVMSTGGAVRLEVAHPDAVPEDEIPF